MSLGITGHKTRGNEVIKILESLGGKNHYKLNGVNHNCFYYIGDKDIRNSYIGPDEIKGYEIFSLEDFLEKSPYLVGDKVHIPEYESEVRIDKMYWDGYEIQYEVYTDEVETYSAEELNQCNKPKMNNTPKNMEEKKINQMSLADCDLEITDGKYYEALGYKIDDVIFTNDTGWIRITKKLWDCFANEHVYEGSGIINGHEYKDIRHHNVIGKMQSDHLKHCNDEEPQIDTSIDYSAEILKSMNEEVEKRRTEIIMETLYTAGITCEFLEKHGFTLPDGYHFADRSGNTIDTTEIRLVKNPPHYPKTYEECCDVLNIPNDERYIDIDVPLDYNKVLNAFTELLICREAYWKIAGEWMGLDKPWEPEWANPNIDLYVIINGCYNQVYNAKYERCFGQRNFTFPTIEMRDAFCENFKDLIEQCKELL